MFLQVYCQGLLHHIGTVKHQASTFNNQYSISITPYSWINAGRIWKVGGNLQSASHQGLRTRFLLTTCNSFGILVYNVHFIFRYQLFLFVTPCYRATLCGEQRMSPRV